MTKNNGKAVKSMQYGTYGGPELSDGRQERFRQRLHRWGWRSGCADRAEALAKIEGVLRLLDRDGSCSSR